MRMKLPVSHLEPGMVLSRGVYGPDGRLLLNRGVKLTAKYIFFLQKYNVLAVTVHDAFESIIPPNENVLADEVKVWTATTVRQWALRNKKTTRQFRAVADRVSDIVDEIMAGKVPLEGLSEISSADIYTFTHSVDVCALAVYCGMKLGYNRSKLIILGMGSLLHDLGKVKIDNKIINKPGTLSPEEYDEIKEHTTRGYRMVKEEINTDIDSRSALILLNHHERFDGSGYPRGIMERDIDEMSVICALSDVYNAMIVDRVYRKALQHNEVYEMMLASGNVMFNIDTLKIFLTCIDPYPEGSCVKLNTGDIGIVKKVDPELPFRPVLGLIDSNEEVDLKKELSLVITGTPENSELRQLAQIFDQNKLAALV